MSVTSGPIPVMSPIEIAMQPVIMVMGDSPGNKPAAVVAGRGGLIKPHERLGFEAFDPFLAQALAFLDEQVFFNLVAHFG